MPPSALSRNISTEDIHSDKETDSTTDITNPDHSDLILYVRVYALAEKYDIPPLKALLLEKFEKTA